MDGGNAPGIMKYGDDWRFTRRVYHQELNPSTVARYIAPQRKYALYVYMVFMVSGGGTADLLLLGKY
jgi:hypothetical protein